MLFCGNNPLKRLKMEGQKMDRIYGDDAPLKVSN